MDHSQIASKPQGVQASTVKLNKSTVHRKKVAVQSGSSRGIYLLCHLDPGND